jgi:CheY-like chemotaxis protein
MESQLIFMGEQKGAPTMPDPAVVVIADDERTIADVVGLLVADLGLTPLVVYDGRQALELARAARPAIVIADLMMPLIDGAALVQALRDDHEVQGDAMPRVILMSAVSRTYAEGVGADAFLRKPFDPSELEVLLHRCLDR